MKKSINNICRAAGAIAVSDEWRTYTGNLFVFCSYIFRPTLQKTLFFLLFKLL